MTELHSITTVAVGSTNPVKLAAVRSVLERLGLSATIAAVAAPSGVPDQPWSDEETKRGAENRARTALLETGAQLAISIEGGVVENGDGSLRTCAWAVALDVDGRHSTGGSLAMPLPEVVAARIRSGEELGHAMDAVASAIGTKHGRGAVGILTSGLIDRQRAYEPLVTYALAPWIAPDYFDSGL